MKPNATHFQLLKKLISTPFNKKITNSIARKWITTAITAVILMVGLEKPLMSAITYTWVGGASGSWTTPANWDSVGSTPSKKTYPGNATTDIAAFSGTYASVNVTGVPTTQIATLSITGTPEAVTLTPATTNTLTVATFTIKNNASNSFTLASGLTVIYSAGNNFNNGGGGTVYGPGAIELTSNYNNFPGNGTTFGNSGSGYPGLIVANGIAVTLQYNGNAMSVGSLSIGTSTASTTSKLTLSNNFNLTVTGTFSNYGSTSGDGLVGANPGGTLIFSGSNQTFPQGAGTNGVFSSSPSVTIPNGVAVSVDANVTVNVLSIGTTSAGTNSSLNLNSNTLTLSGNNASLNNYGTGTNGLIGPGTLILSANNIGIPSASASQGGVFYGSSAANYPSVTISNSETVTLYAPVTVNNLSIGTSSGSALLNMNSYYTITVNGTFTNFGSSNNDGLKGPGTIVLNKNTEIPGNGLFSSQGNSSYPNVVVNGAITVTANAALTIDSLTINNASGIFNDSTFAVTVQGNIANSGTNTSGVGGSINLTNPNTLTPARHLLSGGGSYGKLILNDNNNPAILSGNATINGALTLTNGIFDASTFGDTVFVSSTGSVSRTNGSVYGYLAEYFASGSNVAQTFQVSDSTNYRPVTVTFPSVTTPGYLIVNNTAGAFSPAPTAIVQDVAAYWDIVNHKIAPSSATVTFSYLSGDIAGGSTQGNFVVETYNTNNSTWLSPWTTTNPTGTSTQATSVTTFGDFVIGDTTLPVQISAGGPLSFCQGGSVTLTSIVNGPYYTYSWYQNDAPLGITTANYTATTSGRYYLEVEDTVTSTYYRSDSLTVTVGVPNTVNAGSAPAAICQGGTTAALGGSWSGAATSAIWSDGGAGGSFANNGGSTPGTATYTASSSAPSTVTLKLTTSGGTCPEVSAQNNLTVNPTPVIGSLTFPSPAIICGGPVTISASPPAGTYQWLLNGSPIAGANSTSYAADTSGVYSLQVTSANSCSSTSSTITVGEPPHIVPTSITLPCSSPNTTISLTPASSFSYGGTGSCYVNMSNANIITTTTSTGGGVSDIICSGGHITSEGGSCTFVVEPGGTLDGFGGAGAETVYVKSGGTFNPNNTGNPSGNTIYYEPGAIITASTGAWTLISCSDIGVIYPTGTSQLCDPYTYLWSANAGSSTASSVNITATYTPTTYSVTVTQGDYQCVNSVVVSLSPATWVGGNNSNDWSTATNWNPNVVPNICGCNVTLPAGANDPVINSPVSVGNITVTGSGRELIQLNSSLSVCGNWTDNSGTSSYASGSQLILNGSSAQTLSGNLSFDQLAIDNTNGGVSLAAGTTVGINTALLLQTGNLNTGNGTVTLNSTSVTQAAIIDNFSAAASPGQGTITGNITAQRFYGPASILSDSKQHMLGSPVNGINLSALGSTSPSSAYYEAKTGGIHNCDELVGQYETPYGNVFTYDETHASTCTMDGWKVGADTTAVSAGTGYSVVLGSGSGTLALTGSANLNTTYSVPATNSGYPNTTSDQGRVYSSGINLLSNPYPASLDPTELISDNPAFSGAVYVWNESTGSYYQPTSIAPFQAFMVFLGSPGVESSGNYVIKGTSRTTTEGSFQRVQNPIELSITVTNTSSGLTDETTVGFNPNSTSTFNQQYDLIKFPGALGRHTLYSLNSNDWMWVNVLKSIDETSTVSVGFEPGVSGTYVATFNGINSFDPTSYVTLEDLQTGAIHDVRSGDYSFTSNASDNFNRFVLHFTPPAIILTQDASCETEGIINIEQPGTANWNYTVNDVNNVTVSSGVLNSGNPVSVSVSPGVYTLTLADNTGYTVVKMIQVQGSTPITAAFRTSETTALVSDNIQFTGTTANASTYKWDFGDGTAGSGQQTSHSYQLTGVYTAKLMVTSGSGCISSTSQTITVNTRSVTGISNMTGNDLNIWSYENTVFVDFTKMSNVDAEVQLYNVLGQLLSDERFGKSTLYSKDLTNMEAAYIIVKVITGTQIVTKKVFIANVGK